MTEGGREVVEREGQRAKCEQVYSHNKRAIKLRQTEDVLQRLEEKKAIKAMGHSSHNKANAENYAQQRREKEEKVIKIINEKCSKATNTTDSTQAARSPSSLKAPEPTVDNLDLKRSMRERSVNSSMIKEEIICENTSSPLISATINIALGEREPPSVLLKSPQLIKGNATFYADTGAEVSILKVSNLTNVSLIKSTEKLLITGVTQGSCNTLGTVEMFLNGLRSKLHIVPHDFPISVEGIIGWDLFEKYEGRICAKDSMIELNGTRIPLLKPASFKTPAKSRKIIIARVKESNKNNLIATNGADKVHAERTNVTGEPTKIPVSSIELIDRKTIREAEPFGVDGDEAERFNEIMIGTFNSSVENSSEKKQKCANDKSGNLLIKNKRKGVKETEKLSPPKPPPPPEPPPLSGQRDVGKSEMNRLIP